MESSMSQLALEQRPSGIMALPPEVLLMIFRLVFAYITESIFPGFPSRRPLIHSSKIFPYCVTRVCKTWDFVASMAPEFWTLVVIVLDSTPLHYSKDLFLRSKDLPIEVFILENKPLHRMDPDISLSAERVAYRKLKMQQLIATLTLHLQRCKRLVIQLVDCDLLPRLSDIQVPAPKLTRLVLEANRHEHPPVVPDSALPLFIPSPELSELAIDGLNWYPWFQSQLGSGHKFRDLNRLTLSNLNSSKPGEASSLTMTEFATALRSAPLSTLVLIKIQAEECKIQPTHRVELANLGSLDLIDCDAHFLWSFLSFTNIPPLDDGTIIRCPVDAMPVARGCHLILEEIDAINDLGGFLDHWSGTILEVRNCPAFDNHVLRTLSGTHYRPIRHGEVLSLEIWNSFGFTLDVLRDLVRVRTKLDHGNPLEYLRVYGAPYDLSFEDRDWFKERLSTFTWETQPINDGM